MFTRRMALLRFLGESGGRLSARDARTSQYLEPACPRVLSNPRATKDFRLVPAERRKQWHCGEATTSASGLRGRGARRAACNSSGSSDINSTRLNNY